MPEQLIQVGELADRCGVTVRALRVYERRGLIAPLERGANGYRYFDPEVTQPVLVFGAMLSLGLSLSEIGEIFSSALPIRHALAPDETRKSMERAAAVYRKHIASVDVERARLADVRAALEQRVKRCENELTHNGAIDMGIPARRSRRSLPGRVEYVTDGEP